MRGPNPRCGQSQLGVIYYNNLRVFENDVKGSTASSSCTQNIAFISENISSTNDVSSAYSASNPFCVITNSYEQTSSYSLLANQSSLPSTGIHEDVRTASNEYDLEENGLENGSRSATNCQTMTGTILLESVETREIKIVGGEMHETLAIRMGEDLVSKKTLMHWSDTEREQLSDASIEIKAYTQGLKKVKAQLVAHQQGQLWDIGYGNHRYDGILSYENEVLQSVFMGKESDFENPPLYDKFVTAGGMHDDYPHRALKHKGITDSGCSMHMTGNKAYLAAYQDFNGGPVTFGGSKWYITGKGKIKIGKLDFEDVCFVKELQHFNLFSVSQICDKKNKVIFTDSEYLVLSPEFKLPDENQVLLRIPRQNNMYSFNLENIVPSGGLACLIAKTTIDESNKWHKRLGHVNFKNINKLVKGNLIRGLPSKIFQNDHTCVACQKGKQHKASCKAKSVSSIKFKNMDFIEFCESKGIKKGYSNARTQQQNKVAKRKNRTLIEAARTMLLTCYHQGNYILQKCFSVYQGIWLDQRLKMLLVQSQKIPLDTRVPMLMVPIRLLELALNITKDFLRKLEGFLLNCLDGISMKLVLMDDLWSSVIMTLVGEMKCTSGYYQCCVRKTHHFLVLVLLDCNILSSKGLKKILNPCCDEYCLFAEGNKHFVLEELGSKLSYSDALFCLRNKAEASFSTDIFLSLWCRGATKDVKIMPVAMLQSQNDNRDLEVKALLSSSLNKSRFRLSTTRAVQRVRGVEVLWRLLLKRSLFGLEVQLRELSRPSTVVPPPEPTRLISLSALKWNNLFSLFGTSSSSPCDTVVFNPLWLLHSIGIVSISLAVKELLVLWSLKKFKVVVGRFVQLLIIHSKGVPSSFAYPDPSERVLDQCLPQNRSSGLRSNWVLASLCLCVCRKNVLMDFTLANLLERISLIHFETASERPNSYWSFHLVRSTYSPCCSLSMAVHHLLCCVYMLSSLSKFLPITILVDRNVFCCFNAARTQPGESETSEIDICESNISSESPELVSEQVVNESNVECQPKDYPHRALQNKGIVDSGCSRHMTGNKAYLAEYQDFNGGPVAFGGSKGYITGKGKIKTGKLDFEDVCFVKELQHFNLFSVSQMCDKKNKVLFTDSECLVLSPEFKLPDANQVLLRIPRQNNMYSFNLENIVPSGGLACLIVKATIDESNKWHRRDFIEFCGSKGIKREYSNARTPQQNGVAKRKNMTLIEAARTMLADSFLPNTFWAEAVSTACYVLNRVLVTKPHNKTPYELVTGKIPIISYIRPFGCHVTILNTIDHLGKFDGKSDEGFLVGYSLQSKENQANKHAGPQEANQNAGTEDIIDAGDSEKEDESAQDYFVLPIWSSYSPQTCQGVNRKDAVMHSKQTV
ncbi:ribonuclease H-like domain-containing protein [Tanacetum coccineum]|uniref:Ribonuclease H-like domain-containing protein n=1 Tax=Tanacetum coccineum TaxID=301880 RepID=A0ABQ5BD10_9ASTR